jgi:hypothetical protein
MPPNPNSIQIMAKVDRMKPAERKLVHEYGFVVVYHSLPCDLETLHYSLEIWRERRQAEMLR